MYGKHWIDLAVNINVKAFWCLWLFKMAKKTLTSKLKQLSVFTTWFHRRSMWILKTLMSLSPCTVRRGEQWCYSYCAQSRMLFLCSNNLCLFRRHLNWSLKSLKLGYDRDDEQLPLKSFTPELSFPQSCLELLLEGKVHKNTLVIFALR